MACCWAPGMYLTAHVQRHSMRARAHTHTHTHTHTYLVPISMNFGAKKFHVHLFKSVFNKCSCNQSKGGQTHVKIVACVSKVCNRYALQVWYTQRSQRLLSTFVFEPSAAFFHCQFKGNNVRRLAKWGLIPMMKTRENMSIVLAQAI